MQSVRIHVPLYSSRPILQHRRGGGTTSNVK